MWSAGVDMARLFSTTSVPIISAWVCFVPFQFNRMVDTGGAQTHDLLSARQAFYRLNYWPINTLWSFIGLTVNILWPEFKGVMTPPSVIFPWFDLSTTGFVRRSSVRFFMCTT
mgnify:CR=1 FL=1